ncbi:MAG: hypothetical protein WC730_02100 [Patescibacteria group bacterium]|jgi:hypothetical protein
MVEVIAWSGVYCDSRMNRQLVRRGLFRALGTKSHAIRFRDLEKKPSEDPRLVEIRIRAGGVSCAEGEIEARLTQELPKLQVNIVLLAEREREVKRAGSNHRPRAHRRAPPQMTGR